MILRTKRLLLRPWEPEDAPALYRYASDPRIGPIAGWPAHVSVEDSRRVIREVLSTPETYALILRGETEPVGCAGLMTAGDTNDSGSIGPNDGEVGYWIGVPYWGQGLVPEAVRELLRRGFENLGLAKIWCVYYDGNDRSKRAAQKCGFRYHHTERQKLCPLLGQRRTEHFSCITREEWQQDNLQKV